MVPDIVFPLREMQEETTHPGINIQLILPHQSPQFSNFDRKLLHIGKGGGTVRSMWRGDTRALTLRYYDQMEEEFNAWASKWQQRNFVHPCFKIVFRYLILLYQLQRLSVLKVYKWIKDSHEKSTDGMAGNPAMTWTVTTSRIQLTCWVTWSVSLLFVDWSEHLETKLNMKWVTVRLQSTHLDSSVLFYLCFSYNLHKEIIS